MSPTTKAPKPSRRPAAVPTKGPVIVYGPPACGKTRNGAALARHYGKKGFADLEDGCGSAVKLPDTTLQLTNIPRPGAIPFAAAMRAAGLAG